MESRRYQGNHKSQVERAQVLIVHIAAKGPFDQVASDHEGRAGRFERAEGQYVSDSLRPGCRLCPSALFRRAPTLGPQPAQPEARVTRVRIAPWARRGVDSQAEVAKHEVLGDGLQRVQEALEPGWRLRGPYGHGN